MRIMKAIPMALLFLHVSAMALPPQPAAKGPYFGQPHPGPDPTPLTFPAPIGRPDHFIRAVTFSPSGDEAWWPVIDTQDGYKRWIVFTRLVNGTWTEPQTASWSNKDFYDDVPCLAPSGDDLFFLSGRPLETGGPIDKERIWRMTRTEGGWSAPVPLPPTVNEAYGIHQQLSLDRDGHLYFGGEGDGGQGDMDIHRTRVVDGGYETPENIGPPVNSPAGEYAPTIAPDGSYLLFTRNLDAGWSLFLSFRQPDGAWAPPVDLRPHLPGMAGANLSGSFITADGGILVFFKETDEASVPYWVDTSFIEALQAAPVR